MGNSNQEGSRDPTEDSTFNIADESGSLTEVSEHCGDHPTFSLQKTETENPAPDPATGVGELFRSHPGKLRFPILFHPRSQPSIFWKAFANTIVPLLSNASNLADEDQAIFLATFTQAGIPGGNLVPQEVTNFQVAVKADAVQELNRPSFSLEGPSYFGLLGKFFRHLESGDEAPEIEGVRQALLKATEAKDRAWQAALARYNDRLKYDPSPPPFNDFLNEDVEYEVAWKHERKVQSRYTSMQSEDMEDISRQVDIIKSADDRLSPKINNNMPCSAMNNDYVREALLERKHIQVDPATIFYQPLHTLPAWKMICNGWVDSGDTPCDYTIDFGELENVTWESLGHKDIDEAKPPTLGNHQRRLLKKLKGQVSFYGKPRVVDIERGLWDVRGFRQAGQLSKHAPDIVKNKFCKTTKFLLCWGFEIVLTLPENIGSRSIEDVSLSFLKVPLAKDPVDGRRLRFATERTNYPWLMATLASVV